MSVSQSVSLTRSHNYSSRFDHINLHALKYNMN